MNRKRPRIIQINKDTHKILKIMSAEQGRPMGEIAEDLIRQAQKPTARGRWGPRTDIFHRGWEIWDE